MYKDEDGVFIAEVPSLPGCNSFGDTREEALERVKEAIEVYIESLVARNLEVPIDTAEAEVVKV